MKHLTFILFMFGVADHSTAQTIKEWFLQKQTQKEYLIQQIAALQVYAGYVEKGYDIARNGLNTIGVIKKGDLNLHAGYFSSLKKINPSVSSYARVADIIRLQLEILSVHKLATKQFRQSSQFTTDEKQYMDRVYASLLEKSADLMDELFLVTAGGKVEMKDNERLERIDRIYGEMQEVQEFAQSFFSQAQTLSIQRQKEKHNIQSTRLLYGTK